MVAHALLGIVEEKVDAVRRAAEQPKQE